MSDIRTFEHFPKDDKCIFCQTNEDKECFLIPKDGTDEGNICQAIVCHVDCIKQINLFRYNEANKVVYRLVD